MSNLVTNDFTKEQIELIKKTIAPPGITDQELLLFTTMAKRTGLDPFSRQIYCTKIKDKISVQATVDGLRLVAERSGKYEGQTPTYWCGKDGIWKDVWLTKEYPSAAKVGVYKAGFREPLWSIAIFDEYVQKSYSGDVSFMWKKMPALMIGKVAESLSLRKAFPNELSGIYSKEEMDQVEINDRKEEHPKLPNKVIVDVPNNSDGFDSPLFDDPAQEFVRTSEGLDVAFDSIPESKPSRSTVESLFELVPSAQHLLPKEFLDAGNFVMPTGKFKDKKLSEINKKDLDSWFNYWTKAGVPVAMKQTVDKVKLYLNK